jgi:hypothetical protein
MKKQIRNFIITTDAELRGIGYTKLKDDTQIIHTIYIFMFIIGWAIPIKIGKKQIAKWISPITVQVDKKLYDFDYYSNVGTLESIYYKDKYGTWNDIYKFQQLDNGKYALEHPLTSKWIVVDSIDVYLLNPDSKIEGYIKGNTFIGIKSIIVG